MRGCLATRRADRGSAPDFAFREDQSQALAAFLATDGQSLSRDVPAETARRFVRELRCTACHTRDADQSPRAIVVAEESRRGLPPEPLPNLTWTGEKLLPDWTRRLLAGQLPYQTRPWLKARMPRFPVHAEWLAQGLATEHGFSAEDDARPAFDPQLTAAGQQLSLKTGGLDCRQCHSVGREQPVGDQNTQLALGINFAHTRDRLRYDFYRRFVLDPPRYDVGTKMPKLSPDGKTTAIKDILAGDARRQFDALWQFVQSVEAAPPQ